MRDIDVLKKIVSLLQMGRIEKNTLIKALLLVCVVMQAVALMPHHHHGDTEAICLNYTHVHADGSDVCTKDHDHSASHPYTSCNSYNIVIAQPEFRNDEIATVSTDLPDCSCGLCVIDFIAEVFNGFKAEQNIIKYPDSENSNSYYLRTYLATARPSRAPDFIG